MENNFSKLPKDSVLRTGHPPIKIKRVKLCPNCKKKWDGIECEHCSFDAYCYDPNWD